jgi:hypothetical protein
MRASIAATGIVRSGSSWRRRWYVSTMLGMSQLPVFRNSKGGSLLERVGLLILRDVAK